MPCKASSATARDERQEARLRATSLKVRHHESRLLFASLQSPKRRRVLQSQSWLPPANRSPHQNPSHNRLTQTSSPWDCRPHRARAPSPRATSRLPESRILRPTDPHPPSRSPRTRSSSYFFHERASGTAARPRSNETPDSPNTCTTSTSTNI